MFSSMGGLAQAGGVGSSESEQVTSSLTLVQTFVIPRLRQAARRCSASRGGQRSAIWKRKDRALQTTIAKFEKMSDKIKKQVARMEQRYFMDSWLLPCSLRSHRTAIVNLG